MIGEQQLDLVGKLVICLIEANGVFGNIHNYK